MTGRLAVGLLISLAVPAAADSEEAPAEVASVWSGFEAVDMAGRPWTAEQLQGRVVLLDFWASWCAPCLTELPALRQATERFGARGFMVLGISMNRSDRRVLKEFLRRQGIDWPQIHDGRGFDGAIARRFRVQAVPRTLLVDRSGRIVGVDLTSEVLLAALPTLLGGDTAGPTRAVAAPRELDDPGSGLAPEPGTVVASSRAVRASVTARAR